MKNKVIVLGCGFLVVVIGYLFNSYYGHREEIIVNKNANGAISSNALTMMYETEYQSGEYVVSTDSTWPHEGYTFNADLSGCENGSTLTWDDENKNVVLQANKSDKCYVYFDKEPTLKDYCSGLTLSDCIKNHAFISNGENDLYYHDASLANGAKDNSYRYAGTNPNNYVCFGSDAEICPNDNLYRIIGVFGDYVKLVKNVSTGIRSWNTSDNVWSSSSKPSIYQYLNTTYYGTININWQKFIYLYIWQVGGGDNSNLRNIPQIAYSSEMNTSYEESMYVGLMYVSDYGYAASPESWTTPLSDYDNVRTSNWLYSTADEWTISRDTSSTTSTFIVDLNGIVGTYFVTDEYEVRPSFYLTPWTLYYDGDGTQENPYRISALENLISFTINGKPYYAEEGMTWNDLSLYYSLNVRCDSSYCFYTSGNDTSNQISINGVSVIPFDTILENGEYTLNKTHSGGSN